MSTFGVDTELKSSLDTICEVKSFHSFGSAESTTGVSLCS